MGRCQGPMHHVIQGCVPVMSTHTPSTAWTMCGLAIHLSSTMGTRMRPTKGSTKVETHGHPKSIVIHAEALGGDWQCGRPTATLRVLSSMRRPWEEIGNAFSHAPASLVEAARRRARDLGSGSLSNKLSATSDAFNVSQAFWSSCAVSSGGESSCPRDHYVLASSKWEIEEFRRRGGTRWGMRSAEAAAEARKAEGASCTAHCIPSPPNFTRSEA